MFHFGRYRLAIDVPSLIAQESLQEKLDELDHIGFGWIYDNFDQAKAEAKERNHPIFALFR